MFLLRPFLELGYATLSRLIDLCSMQAEMAEMAETIAVEREKTFVVQAAEELCRVVLNR
jgi:hypothetical protein